MTYMEVYVKLQAYIDAHEDKPGFDSADREQRTEALCRAAVEIPGYGERFALERSDIHGVIYKIFAMAGGHRVHIGYFELAGFPGQTVAVRIFGLRKYGGMEFDQAVLSMADGEALK